MTYNEVSRNRLVEDIDNLSRRLAASQIQTDNTGRYTIENLHKYRERILSSNTPQDIADAADLFGRACVESMNWDTELYKECSTLQELGFQLARKVMKDSDLLNR